MRCSTGVDTNRHSATLALGTPGVLHGVRTYLLQSPTGQIIETHSVSAGLDYPGVGPEHAWLKDSNRAEYIVATDEDALRGFRMCTQLEGIIPGQYHGFFCSGTDKPTALCTALESAHALWGAMKIAETLPKEADVVVVSTRESVLGWFITFVCQCLSGRGDKDVEQISELLPGKWSEVLDWHVQ
jgi:tryptophan synthase